jgi:hypothetical protein
MNSKIIPRLLALVACIRRQIGPLAGVKACDALDFVRPKLRDPRTAGKPGAQFDYFNIWWLTTGM